MNSFIKNFFTVVLHAMVKLYQYVISPLMGPSCRFHPTCSNYALEALQKHGPLRGSFLTIGRICRCHPWGGADYFDPVPNPNHKHCTTHHSRKKEEV